MLEAEAIRRTGALNDEDLTWVEDSTLVGDFSGHAQKNSRTRIPVQLGLNWWATDDMVKSSVADASDLGMPNAMKIGGVLGWLPAVALAEAAVTPVSCHLLSEVSSHLPAFTPTAHWLE